MKKPSLFSKKPLLPSVIMAAILVFLAIILISSAVRQFARGHWFSGCVSILGVILAAAVGALVIVDLHKKKKEKNEHND